MSTATLKASPSLVPNIIELKGLTKHFGKLAVLEDISFDVHEHEILAILGFSGSGKSTLLNIVSGLTRQDGGDVYIGGHLRTKSTSPAKIVYMFQEDRLLPWRTVRDNVAFGLENSGIDRAGWDGRIARVLELVHLSDFATYWPHQLSGGMRSRVALARSLVSDPEILLMDEPFSRLDPTTRQELHEELLKIQQDTGMTIIFVTHDVEEAVVLADRVAVFSPRPGRIREIVDIDLARPRELVDAGVVETVQTLRRKL